MKSSQSVKPTLSQTTPSGDQLTFLEHLREFRKRILAVAAVLLGGTLVGYALHDQLVHFLVTPLGGQKLVYLTPGGGFDFIFKVSLYLGFAVAIPVAIYQLFRYLGPIMGTKSRKMGALVIVLSTLLAIGGMAFGFFVALPAALKFLTTFGGEYVEASLTASSYLNFVMAYMLGMAALFQLPLILLFINKINGPFKPAQLFGSQKYVLLGVFILAAIITPTPDIANQAIVAGPVLVVYQLGVGMVLWQNRNQATALANPNRRLAFTADAAPALRFVAPKRPDVVSQPIAPTKKLVAVPTPVIKQHPTGLRQMDIVTPSVRPPLRAPARTPKPPQQISAQNRRPARSIDGVLQPGY